MFEKKKPKIWPLCIICRTSGANKKIPALHQSTLGNYLAPVYLCWRKECSVKAEEKEALLRKQLGLEREVWDGSRIEREGPQIRAKP